VLGGSPSRATKRKEIPTTKAQITCNFYLQIEGLKMANLSGVFRIGRDAEIRKTASGEDVCNLSLAYNHGRKGEDGSRPTQWLDASLWGKRASTLAQYLVKGQLIYAVINDPHIEEFKKKDGGAGVKMAGSVGEIELISGGTKKSGDSKPAPEKEFPEQDDDLPF
jgi:single-strand DNA-binding protein